MEGARKTLSGAACIDARVFGLLLAIAAALYTPPPAKAFLHDYPPFASSATLRHIKLTKLAIIEKHVPDHPRQMGLTYVLGQPTSGAARLRLCQTEQGWMLTMEDEEARTTKEPTLISEFMSGVVEAYQAELNGDGKPDYVIQIPSGGCGLASLYCDRVFYLSSGLSYHTATELTLSPGPEDFLSSPASATGTRLIHTTFIPGEAGKDGKAHNYWVYHLLDIKGNRIRECKNDPRFPRWIMYTHRPNQRETTQLTQEQKSRLWKKHVQDSGLIDGFFNKPWSQVRPCKGVATSQPVATRPAI